jgi:hypothetical protein
MKEDAQRNVVVLLRFPWVCVLYQSCPALSNYLYILLDQSQNSIAKGLYCLLLGIVERPGVQRESTGASR